jgi:hypothetical protein
MKNGKLATDRKQLQRWQEHFTDPFNQGGSARDDMPA